MVPRLEDIVTLPKLWELYGVRLYGVRLYMVE